MPFITCTVVVSTRQTLYQPRVNLGMCWPVGGMYSGRPLYINKKIYFLLIIKYHKIVGTPGEPSPKSGPDINNNRKRARIKTTFVIKCITVVAL